MKLAIALLTALGSAALSLAANDIPVYLEPSTDAAQIGGLEALSLAVPAEWPENRETAENWQPVYFHGVFDVYVLNSAMAKDLSVKPGSHYFLTPNETGPTLAIATEQDKTDILGVDTWFCKMQLETIVVGYIQHKSIDASEIVSSLPQQATSTTSASSATAVSELVGRLEKAGLVGRNRTGLVHKLIGSNGQTLAFIDFTKVPERIQIDDFVGIPVRVSGFLKQSESSADVILEAKIISKVN